MKLRYLRLNSFTSNDLSFLIFVYVLAIKMLIISSSFRLTRGTQRRFSPKCIENTFQAIQSTFRPLEIHSNRRYKIYICSVILGQFESFRNYQGFSIIFWKILDERGRENFSDSSFHRIFESENFRFSSSSSSGKMTVIMVYTSRTSRNLEGDEDGDHGVKAVRNQSIRTTSFECLLYFNKCRR